MDLAQLLQQGIIRGSSSLYSSPFVILWKKDGSIQLCVDPQQHFLFFCPLKNFDALIRARWLSTLDLESDYHQVEVAEKIVVRLHSPHL